VLAAAVVITVASFRVQPHLIESFRDPPWGYVFPLLAMGGLVWMKIRRGLEAFAGSCLFIVGMLTSAAFGMYPYVLPSNRNPALSLTIENTAAARYGLGIGLVWFIPGIALAAAYFISTYRNFAGKVTTPSQPVWLFQSGAPPF
jgi:cytochrome bd ubiquinol oxidase subunit II